MHLTSFLNEAWGGTRDNLSETETESTWSESIDNSLTSPAPKQIEPCDYHFLPAPKRRRITYIRNPTSITRPPSFLPNHRRNLNGHNRNIFGHRRTATSWGGDKTVTSHIANEHGLPVRSNHSHAQSAQAMETNAAVELSDRVRIVSVHDEPGSHTMITPRAPSFDSFEEQHREITTRKLTRDLARLRTDQASALLDNDAIWSSLDSDASHPSHDVWGDDHSEGDDSAVEEFGNVEYSFSDLDPSDVETVDEDSVEQEYPSDQEVSDEEDSDEEDSDEEDSGGEASIGTMSDEEMLGHLDDLMEDSDSEDLHLRLWAIWPPGGMVGAVSPPSSPPPATPRETVGYTFQGFAPHHWMSTTIPKELPFFVRNESLSEQLKTRNPWRTLQQYYPPLNKTTDAGPCFPILRFPNELLCLIVEQLPAESAVSFTLSSKLIYTALGTKHLKLEDKSSCWKLLLLLEPERQSSFACCVCLKLHRPPITQRVGASKCAKMWMKREDTKLSAPITSGLVKMIGRKHLEDPRACQEYLSWATDSFKITTRYIKVARHVTARMVNGNLFIKTETYAHPFHKGKLTHRSIHELFRLAEPVFLAYEKLYSICGHRSWEKELAITKKRKSFLDDPIATKCRGHAGGRSHHSSNCYSNRVICDVLKEAVLPPRVDQMLRESDQAAETSSLSFDDDGVRSCDKCFTDYSVTACNVAGVGRCMVFTTWKDLGGVRPGQQDKWDTFVGANIWRGGRSVTKVKKTWSPWPEAYLSFQNLEIPSFVEEDDVAVQIYQPRPDWKMVRDLTRKTKKRRFSIADEDHQSDEEDYPTTSSDADTDSGEETGGL